jgi:hypothetical protein
MTKRFQEIIARLWQKPAAKDVPDAFDRLPRLVASEAKRKVRLTPLAVR